MSKILLVDDHPIVIAACRLLLEQAGIAAVFHANDAATAYQAFLQHKPDVIIVDLRLQGEELGGLALIERLRSHDIRPAILVFSMHFDPRIVSAAIAAGATGYLAKDAPPDELAQAVEQVRSGQPYMDPDLAKKVALIRPGAEDDRFATLTPREQQVLGLLAEGKPYQAIADHLGISYKTVVNLTFRLRQKLGARGLSDLIRLAVEITRQKSLSEASRIR